MLRRDAETPAVLGHKAGRTRFCSRPSGTQVIPSGPPHTCSFSRPGFLLARLLFQLHLRLSRPLLSPSRGDRGAAPPTPAPAFAHSLQEHRVFTAAGTLFRGWSRPRVGAPGSGGRRGSAWLLSCGKPGSNRNNRVQRPERLRWLGGVSCGDRAVGLIHGLKNTHGGTFRPRLSLSSPGSRRGCLRAVWLSGRSCCRSAAPHSLSLSLFFCGPSPNPPSAPSIHSVS